MWRASCALFASPSGPLSLQERGSVDLDLLANPGVAPLIAEEGEWVSRAGLQSTANPYSPSLLALSPPKGREGARG